MKKFCVVDEMVVALVTSAKHLHSSGKESMPPEVGCWEVPF